MKKILEKYITEVFETKSDYSEWFGYYNYDVLSNDDTKMLCGRCNFDARSIKADDKLELGYYDLTTGTWNRISETDSFNWQQGSMLQWLPGNDNKLVYNVTNDNHFGSVIQDIVTGDKRLFNYPIYCVTPDGKKAITLNYERSYWCRAYHYQTVINKDYDVRVADDDGVFSLDFSNNTITRIIDINDVIALDKQADFDKARHWLEHIMISPSGTRFVFLHRFSYGSAYETRICIADIDGNNLQLVDGWKKNFWSHIGWRTDDSFVVYSVKRNSFQASYAKGVQKAKSNKSLMTIVNKAVHTIIPKALKDFLKPKEKGYELFQLINGRFEMVEFYQGELLNIDGHPSFTKDGRYMITDSYPDKNGFQRLIIYDTETKKGVQVALFEAPLSGNPASCDLHPKLSSDNMFIAVDTACNGKHQMMLFRVLWDNIKTEIS